MPYEIRMYVPHSNVGRWQLSSNWFIYQTEKPSKWKIFWHEFFLGWKWEDIAS